MRLIPPFFLGVVDWTIFFCISASDSVLTLIAVWSIKPNTKQDRHALLKTKNCPRAMPVQDFVNTASDLCTYVWCCVSEVGECFVCCVELGLEPKFDEMFTNVTVVASHTATLPCSIDFLGKHKVCLPGRSIYLSIYLSSSSSSTFITPEGSTCRNTQ